MSIEAGSRVGPYEILGAIGSGGMGVVYRARDTRLGRTVAIKLARPLTADDQQARRLLREAQHASALNHPNSVRFTRSTRQRASLSSSSSTLKDSR